MAHFAEIDENNIVLRVVVVDDENEADGENWCNGFFGGTWKQTSINTHEGVHALGGTPFRKNFAGIGYTYDAERDAFIRIHNAGPGEWESWTLEESTCNWKAPIDRPAADNIIAHFWDESAFQTDNSTYVEKRDNSIGWKEVTHNL
jgi:hypothetical protein